ncbi:MAG: M28 family peptidase [Candidatus Eiseniibacteriota bacterium]
MSGRSLAFLRTLVLAAALAGASIAAFCAFGARPASAAADPLAPAELQATVKTLSDTAWTGRGPGTPGLDRAAEYLARRFEAAGLRPGGDGGTFFQTFDINTGVELLEGENALVTRRGGPWRIGSDYLPLGFSSSGRTRAPIVFAGYGITAPEYGYDDYATLDVKDRVVIVLRYEPGEDDSTSRFEGRLPTVHSDLRTKAINAREHGATGLLLVTGPRYRTGEEELSRLRPDAAYMSSGLLAASITRAIADSLLVRHGLTITRLQEAIDVGQVPHSVAFPDTVEIAVGLERKVARAKNVVGVRNGKAEGRAIVIGAHYDHLGYGGESSLAPRQYGLVHPGADDNASGTAALVGLAEERATPEHDRWFAAFAGEEMGLVGSSYFVELPPMALDGVAAMLNMDMVGRLRDNKLMVMGIGTAVEFPDLLRNVNQTLPERARFDLKTSEDGYGPSDHTSFYKKQRPVLMFFTGAHADYHRPSDTWEKVDAAGLSRVAEFVGLTADAIDRLPAVTYKRATEDTTRRMVLRGGHGAWLGSIPDYTQTEGGVLLSGVRESSPAQAAGIRGGDTIVKIDQVKIDNIYDFTFVLQSHRPGDVIQVHILRDGKPQALSVTLGRRTS